MSAAALASEITLSRRQAGALMRLLASHEEDLEALIKCHTIDGEVMPGDYDAAVVVAEARRQWRESEFLRLAVEQQLCQRRAS